ncbi:ankyrin repeat and SOCS box protein 2-like isoform X2 [Anguilla anguilla]|uniref:ankyrin repeat and SOCS box protein 2-like isoform X2 n=1 Tax=Anguilla anguilla TaxID=7936 RepID=UPI0015B236C5|nr:ankyrin repeat and SOCS box protein 2-like isoform X2 [Anguilla anguilla]XP_035258875.1 ankyrin repeat and SOCS box protein 2-like isoform X2 [Anguilla anguilla]XP_035258883.1 ankyrin repeat and SOCS box protein 2-like isoform X2 [Anguilla anguilla]
MAASSISTGGSLLGFEDYSLYTNLSDEELIHLAIERSLTDTHATAVSDRPTRMPACQSVNSAPRNPALPPPQNVQPPANPLCGTNDFQQCKNTDGTKNYPFVTGCGERSVAWRRCDGSLYVTPDPVEDVYTIVTAIKNGDVKAVNDLSSSSAKSLMLANKDGWIPLHEAAYYNQVECVKVLLKAQPTSIDKRTLLEQTALLLAVARESLACVQYLLEKGADPEIASKNKDTPLYKACEMENVEIVALILKFGGGVNQRCIQGWTALHEAVCRNNIEICEMLVAAGAAVNPPDMYGITPLFVAAQSGRVEALCFLIKNGADVNSQAADGATALFEASKNGHKGVVEILLTHNVDANRPAKSGLLPLHIAADRGFDEIVSLLLPATSRARLRRSGVSPLHLAAEKNQDDALEVLIKAGFDVNAKLSHDRSIMYEDRRSTALYFAVTNNNVAAATMLLEAGADPNLDTFNALLVAVRQGCINTVVQLVEHGANVNATIPTYPTSFPSSVMFCVRYLPLLKYLMDRGCNALACFRCQHGSKPHPPINAPRSRGTDGIPAHSHSETPLQFCEMLSSPSVSSWAGPVIDLLLDYVGNVVLCVRLTEHLDSYEDWAVIKEKSRQPRPLMHLCRQTIRRQMGIQRLKHLDDLPLPGRLIKYMNNDRTRDECLY